MRENGDPLEDKHSLSDEICEYVHSRSKEKQQLLKDEQLKLIEADRSETLTKDQGTKTKNPIELPINIKIKPKEKDASAFFMGGGGAIKNCIFCWFFHICTCSNKISAMCKK